MIVQSIQHLVSYVREGFRTTIYKTMLDPITKQEIVKCEVYTAKGKVDKLPDKGNEIDKKA